MLLKTEFTDNISMFKSIKETNDDPNPQFSQAVLKSKLGSYLLFHEGIDINGTGIL